MKNRYPLHKNRKSSYSLFILLMMMRIWVCCLFFIILSGCRSRSESKRSESSNGIEDVLQLLPGADNPRNSEGDFITLKDGRILFIYTHYTDTSGDDHANAYLAGRYSNDKGKTWSARDVKIVEQEGKMNVMSVSLLRLQNGEIALFYLKKNSVTECIPLIRVSDDEAKTWSDPQPCINDNGINQNRTPLNIAVSKDEGKTWSNNKILKDNTEGVYCYPAIHFIDNCVLLGYSDWSTMGSTILRINLDWIYKYR